ncbi:MAG: PTS sugar transporter subunit IIC [Gilliamella sp.]|nr:PTS sugar transporter subunit IIC [Gilliamella sp.]
MKDKITTFFQKLQPGFDKVGNNKYLQSIMGAMMATLGPMIIGSFATLIAVYATKWRMMELAKIMGFVNSVTIGAIALYVSFLMAKYVAKMFLSDDDGTSAGIISLMSFLIITPLDNIKNVAVIPTTWIGADGLFSAMIVGIIVGRSFAYMKKHNWTIKMPAGVPPMVSNTFAALIPTLLLGVFFTFVALGFSLTSFGSLHQLVYGIIQAPLQHIGGSFWAMVFVCLIEQLVWFFGIHGTNVITPIVMPIWMALDMQNLAAYKAGRPVPNIYGYAFFNFYTWGGTALGLVLLMLFISKSERFKTLGKIAIVPALFGITEPVIFGTPLVLNFDFFVPFVTNNAIVVMIAGLLTKLGIVARCTGAQAVFGLPLGFHALLGGHISIVILVLIIQLIIAPLLWYPWFKIADKKAYDQEHEAIK